MSFQIERIKNFNCLKSFHVCANHNSVYKIKKNFFSALVREEIPNTTKIIIAQRISSVEDADKIIVMDNGEINGIGTHEELLKNNEIYSEVYNSQVKGGGDDE